MAGRNEKNTVSIKDFLELVGSRADLSKDEVVKILLEAISLIFNNDFDPNAKLDLTIEKKENGENEIKLYILNKVVTDFEPEEEEKLYSIFIDDAKKIDPSFEENTTFKDEILFESFNPSTFIKIYNVFTQSIKEYSKEYLFNKYGDLQGKIVRAKIEGINFGRNNQKMVSLIIEKEGDFLDAFMPAKLQNPNIEMVIGEYINVFVEDVKPDNRGIRIIVSNTSNEILKKILEVEVPEIASGNIEVNAIRRIPGIRSKIAVSKTSIAPSAVDPMGSIVGQKGSRINKISEELGGEKIDVILYDSSLEKFIVNAISPAHVVHVSRINDEANNHFLVVVPDADNTKAIGKAGQNVKLAAGLTETRLDIMSVTEAKEKGITLLFNGNIDENNNIIGRSTFPRNNRNFNNFGRNTNFNSIMEDFDKEVETYKTDILSLQEEDRNFEDFSFKQDSIENILNKNNSSNSYSSNESFTTEDLEKINGDFETDSDIANYDDFAIDDIDIEGADWD